MTLSAAIEAVTSALDQLDKAATEADGVATVEELASGLVALRDLRARLGDAHNVVEDLLTARLARSSTWELTVPHVGTIKRHAGKKRQRWDHEGLFAAAVKRAREVGPLTFNGRTESPGEAVARIIASACQPAYWRAKAVKAWGVDPDEYAEVSWGRSTIEIVR